MFGFGKKKNEPLSKNDWNKKSSQKDLKQKKGKKNDPLAWVDQMEDDLDLLEEGERR